MKNKNCLPYSCLFVLIVSTLCLSLLPIVNYKEKPYNLNYKTIITEKKIERLRMIGKVGRFGVEGKDATEKLYGKILRALRFQNITQKVEKKYGLPKNLVLAMVMHETGGVDLLPNGLDDGGLGVCHMQASLAHQYGLKTYKQCRELRCKTHGKQARSLIKKYRSDRKKLIKYDDRFHPILNLDAAGRMLHSYKSPKINGLTTWQTAIRRYAGKYNYRKYWQQVEYYRKKLNSNYQINLVRKAFNQKNPNLRIGGKKANFDLYIKTHQDQNINYGLRKYK